MKKHLEKRLGGYSYPVVVVQKHKHNSLYYLAHSQEELLKVFVRMVRENNNAEYYYKPEKPKLRDALTEEQIAVLPEKYRKVEAAAVAANARMLRDYEEALEDWKLIQKALSGDGEAAYEVLDNRRDHEYEGWAIEIPVKV